MYVDVVSKSGYPVVLKMVPGPGRIRTIGPVFVLRKTAIGSEREKDRERGTQTETETYRERDRK